MKTQKEILIPFAEYIEELSMRSNLVSISNKNSKTGICVNDLAFPTSVCRCDAPCRNKGGCYCEKGHQAMAKAQSAYLRNLRLYKSDSVDFWEQVTFYIKHNPLPMFRFFDSGDYPTKEFIKESYEIAKRFPNIRFLAYTKRYEWTNEVIEEIGMPSQNYLIRFSAWDKNWKVPNPYDLPLAFVDFKDKEKNPEIPQNCCKCRNQTEGMTCSECQLCWNKDVKNILFKQH